MKILLLLVLSGLVSLGQETAGVGVILGQDGTNLVIKKILPDSPAALSSAIHPGDRITAVAQGDGDAVDVKEYKLAQVIPLFRGPKGTTVRLTLVPPGKDESQARVVSFVRGELKELARWGDGKPLPPGAKAPNIRMVVLPGKQEEQLSDFIGKVVVLEFWATWCGPCQAAMADLQGYLAKFPTWKDKVVIIAASVDEVAGTPVRHLDAKRWDETHNVWVSIEARKAYHIDSIPSTFVIDQNGNASASGHIENLPGAVNRLIQPPDVHDERLLRF